MSGAREGGTGVFDYFNKDAGLLKEKKLFLLDMDGTLYNGHILFDGTPAFLRAIRDGGGRYLFITNNSSRSVKDYCVKLKKMGIGAAERDFFTSSQATALYLNKTYPQKRVYCVGTRSLVKELRRNGIDAVTKFGGDLGDIDVVLVGYDTELTYRKLRDASELLTAGKEFVATNPDKGCPVPFGLVPDCAAICEALFFATGRRPFYVGKPNPTMIDQSILRSGFRREDAVVIGDRLYTDIASGKNAGVTSVLVLSGESTVDDIGKSEIQPDFTFSGIDEILAVLQKKEI